MNPENFFLLEATLVEEWHATAFGVKFVQEVLLPMIFHRSEIQVKVLSGNNSLRPGPADIIVVPANPGLESGTGTGI